MRVEGVEADDLSTNSISFYTPQSQYTTNILTKEFKSSLKNLNFNSIQMEADQRTVAKIKTTVCFRNQELPLLIGLEKKINSSIFIQESQDFSVQVLQLN